MNKKTHDCFNWDTYTQDDYLGQIVNSVSKQNEMLITNSCIENGEAVFKDNLHTNWKEIYHQVIKLKAKSVLEVGCGCTHHLMNLYKLDPTLNLNGIDYSQNQIDLGYKLFNLQDYPFKNNLKVQDFTKDIEETEPKYDLVYTQAVSMHLAHDRAIKFIRNMGKLAKSYIVKVENIQYHDYDVLFKEALPDFERVYDHKYLPTVFVLKRINKV